jgi:signal transduction histidine kinase
LPFAGTAPPRRLDSGQVSRADEAPPLHPVRFLPDSAQRPRVVLTAYDPGQTLTRTQSNGFGAGQLSPQGSFVVRSPSATVLAPAGPAESSIRQAGSAVSVPWAASRRGSLYGPSVESRDEESPIVPLQAPSHETRDLVGPPMSDRPEPVEPAPSPVVKPKAAAPLRGSAAPAQAPVERKAAPVVPVRAPQRGLFGLAPAPFVEGDFVAAWKMPNGLWSVVQPAPEPFPNSWQRRVLIWFAVSFALTAPFGWLFARRIVKPLSGFVEAAELLGRDPSAVVRGLDGPAEVGRAARAFNRMQSRLKSFVDDRTAMVGAISHDLRTPLTRLRFRIEDVESEAMREGMIGEVEEMEQMITSVLAFIRDASTPGVRERLDLGAILDEVARNVALIGGDVKVEAAQPAPVEVDILGIRRLLTNLVENAVKYGERARIRLRIDQDCAVAEVVDDGPGVPEAELERVFEPFYRAANAAGKEGSGLGLAVCRSIARAHGGDVRLMRSERGFVAQLRIPLYDAA